MVYGIETGEMTMEETIGPIQEVVTDEPETRPPKAQMRRGFSLMGLGLCLGLLVSQLVPTVLAALVPSFDVQSHAFLVGMIHALEGKNLQD